jgi:hypothetical protein
VYVVQRTKTDVEAALSPRRGGSRSRTVTSCWIAPGLRCFRTERKTPDV